MGYKDAIQAQVELCEWWMSPAGDLFMQTLDKDEATYGGNSGVGQYNERTGTAAVRPSTIYKKVILELAQGEPVWVNAEVCSLLEYAESSWPERFTLTEQDVPIKGAFVLFESPLWLPELLDDSMNGKSLKADLHAISWMVKTFIIEDEPVLALAYTFYVKDPRPNRPPAITHSGGWIFGEYEDWRNHIPMSPEAQRLNEQHAPRTDRSVRYLMSLLRFITTRVVESPRTGAIGMRLTRRAQDLGVEDPGVRVITLRRPEIQETGERQQPSQPGNWSHRWEVGAHWHNYRLKDGSYRTRWVDTYEKGPEGLPLLKKRNAYRVIR